MGLGSPDVRWFADLQTGETDRCRFIGSNVAMRQETIR